MNNDALLVRNISNDSLKRKGNKHLALYKNKVTEEMILKRYNTDANLKDIIQSNKYSMLDIKKSSIYKSIQNVMKSYDKASLPNYEEYAYQKEENDDFSHGYKIMLKIEKMKKMKLNENESKKGISRDNKRDGQAQKRLLTTTNLFKPEPLLDLEQKTIDNTYKTDKLLVHKSMVYLMKMKEIVEKLYHDNKIKRYDLAQFKNAKSENDKTIEKGVPIRSNDAIMKDQHEENKKILKEIRTLLQLVRIEKICNNRKDYHRGKSCYSDISLTRTKTVQKTIRPFNKQLFPPNSLAPISQRSNQKSSKSIKKDNKEPCLSVGNNSTASLLKKSSENHVTLSSFQQTKKKTLSVTNRNSMNLRIDYNEPQSINQSNKVLNSLSPMASLSHCLSIDTQPSQECLIAKPKLYNHANNKWTNVPHKEKFVKWNSIDKTSDFLEQAYNHLINHKYELTKELIKSYLENHKHYQYSTILQLINKNNMNPQKLSKDIMSLKFNVQNNDIPSKIKSLYNHRVDRIHSKLTKLSKVEKKIGQLNHDLIRSILPK